MALYFRIREGGATAFRREEDAGRLRLDLRPVADIVLKSGAVKPRPGAALDPAEEAEIAGWIEARRARLAAHAAEAPARAVEAMNEAAERLRLWAPGTEADRARAEAETEALLLAMHDLRAAILRLRGGDA